MNESIRGFIQEQIGYRFKNSNLLEQAFTRRSYSEENGGENNEVLEFFGDKVLDFIVVKLFSEWYGNNDKARNNNQSFFSVYSASFPSASSRMGEYQSKYDEGTLTEFKKMLVSRQTLSQKIYDLDLERFLLLGKSDEKNDARNKDSVREDLLEAILGAVAIDSDWNITDLQNVVEVMLDTHQFISGDYFIDDIVEWTIKKYRCTPVFCYSGFGVSIPLGPYTILDKSLQYPYTAHPNHCHLILGDYAYSFWAKGNSRGEAKYNACKCAYEHLQKNDLLFTITDEIEEPTEQMAINQLEILARRGYFELPEYKYTETHDKNGNPKWQVACMIDDVDKMFNATDSSKKKAKKRAAFKMLNYVLEIYDKED